MSKRNKGFIKLRGDFNVVVLKYVIMLAKNRRTDSTSCLDKNSQIIWLWYVMIRLDTERK